MDISSQTNCPNPGYLLKNGRVRAHCLGCLPRRCNACPRACIHRRVRYSLPKARICDGQGWLVHTGALSLFSLPGGFAHRSLVTALCMCFDNLGHWKKRRMNEAVTNNDTSLLSVVVLAACNRPKAAHCVKESSNFLCSSG